MSNQPIYKKKSGQLETAVWERDLVKDGQTFKSQSVSLQKSWKKDDEWKRASISLTIPDVHRAILLLEDVRRELLLKKEVEK
ncbi:MAG: hypothetical protein CL811_12640 [Colwelliaceae bacterium]|jgi:hypothetical protein|nr:hypothetical protein [Colwelliaceae bacterium]|tara:strand:+ start:56 stop:301 length:246 start_codon:yes stop_codon:yes gene_type:complete